MENKVLVVEDNELNLKLFRDLLEANDITVVATKDGNKAIDLVVQENPKVILMDIQLQGVSGLDIIKQIKENKNLRHIPIIAVTAFAMKDDKEKILSSGCEAYISKPISIIPFLNTIKSFLKSPQNNEVK